MLEHNFPHSIAKSGTRLAPETPPPMKIRDRNRLFHVGFAMDTERLPDHSFFTLIHTTVIHIKLKEWYDIIQRISPNAQVLSKRLHVL